MVEHFTIRQAKNEIKKLENELDLYLTKKRINFEKTQTKATAIKDIISSSKNMFDSFTHYVIKDEEVDAKIYNILESITAYRTFIIKEMKRISENGGSELIIFLRDEERLKWEEISKLTNYSLRQCHNLYNKTRNNA